MLDLNQSCAGVSDKDSGRNREMYFSCVKSCLNNEIIEVFGNSYVKLAVIF